MPGVVGSFSGKRESLWSQRYAMGTEIMVKPTAEKGENAQRMRKRCGYVPNFVFGENGGTEKREEKASHRNRGGSPHTAEHFDQKMAAAKPKTPRSGPRFDANFATYGIPAGRVWWSPFHSFPSLAAFWFLQTGLNGALSPLSHELALPMLRHPLTALLGILLLAPARGGEPEKPSGAIGLLKAIDEGFVQVFEKVAPARGGHRGDQSAGRGEDRESQGFEFFFENSEEAPSRRRRSREDRQGRSKSLLATRRLRSRSEGSGFLIPRRRLRS